MTRIGKIGTTLAVTSNRRTLRAHLVFLRSVRRLLVTASVVPILPILVTDDVGAKIARNVDSYNSHTA
jgi:hypothetical protein